MSAEKKTLKQLSLQKKMELLADVDNNIGSRKQIAAKYGIPANTLSTIVKHRHKVETAAKIFFFEPGRKRMRESNYTNVDRQLFAWVRQAQSRNEPVNGITIAERAEQLAEELGEETFKASTGWIDRFKRRHGILYTQLRQNRNGESSSSANRNLTTGRNNNGESRFVAGSSSESHDTDEMDFGKGNLTFSCNSNTDNIDDLGLVISSIFKKPPSDKQAAKEWSQDALPFVLDEYQPADIFCADETELFFRCLPDKLQSQSFSKGKGQKDKVTVLCGVNMTGIEKLPLLVIGKLGISSSSSIETLPLDYIVDKTIAMTPTFFEAWLNQVDEKFDDENRKIALVINTSQAHSSCLSLSLKAVKVIFLPLNTTDLLQPCRQGIIYSFKMHYRTRIVQKYILHARNEINRGNFNCADSFHISIVNALFCMRSAWDQVEKDTIVNSFRHAGFYAKLNHPVVEASVESHLNHLLDRLGQLVPVQTTANAFADIDKDLKLLHRDFVKEDKDFSNGESVEEPSELVSSSDAMKAVETLKKFVQERDLGEEIVREISSIEFKVESAALEENLISKDFVQGDMVEEIKHEISEIKHEISADEFIESADLDQNMTSVKKEEDDVDEMNVYFDS